MFTEQYLHLFRRKVEWHEFLFVGVYRSQYTCFKLRHIRVFWLIYVERYVKSFLKYRMTLIEKTNDLRKNRIYEGWFIYRYYNFNSVLWCVIVLIVTAISFLLLIILSFSTLTVTHIYWYVYSCIIYFITVQVYYQSKLITITAYSCQIFPSAWW